MSKSLTALTALGFILAATATSAADAKRGSAGVVHGPNRSAGGYRSVDRDVGGKSVNSNYQTSGGRGVQTQRDKSWGGGSYNGSASHQYNDGTSSGRSVSGYANGNGTANYEATRTKRDGTTATKTGTVGSPY